MKVSVKFQDVSGEEVVMGKKGGTFGFTKELTGFK